MRISRTFAAGLCALVLALAAGGAGAEEKKLLVVCSLFPQYDFVRQVAEDRAEVQMLLPPRVSVDRKSVV